MNGGGRGIMGGEEGKEGSRRITLNQTKPAADRPAPTRLRKRWNLLELGAKIKSVEGQTARSVLLLLLLLLLADF